MFNLQLFATTTQTTLLSTLSPEMKTYYDMRLIDNAEPNLVHNQFGQKRPIPKNGGKTIEFRKFASLPKALTPLTEGVTPDGNNLNVTNLTATIGQYGDYVQISDLLDLTAIDPIIEETVKILASQAGRTLDTVTRNVIAGGTNVLYADGTTRSGLDSSDKITIQKIFEAAAVLKAANAPTINGSYVAIIHPHVAYDLMTAVTVAGYTWTDIHKYADPEAIFNGELGKVGNVRFVESTEAKIFGPADIVPGKPRFTLKTALDSTGSTTIAVKEEITTAEATALTAAIAAGTVKIYVGGKEVTLSAVTAGAAGSASFTASATVKSVAADSVICGQGAAADGSAIYATIVLGDNAYGVTEITGGGLETIIKGLGEGDDPLNQRQTCGWKATAVAERLVEENMVRIESASSFSATAVSN